MRGVKLFFAIVMFIVSFACLIFAITAFVDDETGNGVGIFCLVITGITAWLGINSFKIRNIKVEQRKPPFDPYNVVPFSGQRIREMYYRKEDGVISDIAKLCIDKPDNGKEIIYITEAMISCNIEDMKILENEIFETTDEAKDDLKERDYRKIKNDEHLEELGLTEYIVWFYN